MTGLAHEYNVTTQSQSILAGLRALHIEPWLDPVQWMDKYYKLVGQSSGIPGDWATFPYQRGMLFAFDDDRIPFVCVQKSTRMGYTKMISGLALRYCTYRKRNVLFYQPSNDDAKDFEKDEIAPAIDASEYIRSHLRAQKSESRTATNTTLRKEFSPAVLNLLGGESGKNYRRLTAHTVIGDEIDEFPENVGRTKDKKQGSPIRLMARALTDSPFKKQIIGSSPTTEQGSLVWRQMMRLLGRTFDRFFPCLECGHLQPLEWGGAATATAGIKMIDRKPHTARYMCRDCGALMEYRDLREMDEGARWQSEIMYQDDKTGEYYALDDHEKEHMIEPPRRMGFFMNSIYSPFLSWEELCETFLEATALSIKGDNSELITFNNHLLGQTWKEVLDNVIDPTEFQAEHTIKYRAQVPAGVRFLTAGVDIQKDHAHIDIVGWANRQINFGIQFTRYFGDLDTKDFWDGLENLLNQEFRNEEGETVKILVAGIDSGHRAKDIYKFCRRNAIKFIPMKGAAAARVQKEIDFPQRRNKDRVFLTSVGGDAITDILRERYSKKINDGHIPTGYSFWPHGQGYDVRYFKEIVISQKVKKGTVWSWEPLSGAANDAEDARKYAYAAMCIAVFEFRRDLDPSEKEMDELTNRKAPDVYDQIKQLARKVNNVN